MFCVGKRFVLQPSVSSEIVAFVGNMCNQTDSHHHTITKLLVCSQVDVLFNIIVAPQRTTVCHSTVQYNIVQYIIVDLVAVQCSML